MSALDEGLSENSIPDSVVVTWPSTEWLTDADTSSDGTSTVTEGKINIEYATDIYIGYKLSADECRCSF